ncbi:MAG: hypothetical protein GW890_10215, partial [Vibrio sp.]|nr:hypothetical protein [Vibrio sp.]
MSKQKKWLNLSRDNASLTLTAINGKQAVLVIGDISSTQRHALEELGFRQIPAPNAIVLASTRFTNKETFKIKLNEIPLDQLASLFPNSAIEEMDTPNLFKMWDGYNLSTQNSIISMVNSARTERALDSYESIGLNENGIEVYLTNSNERFYMDGEHLMFPRSNGRAEFLAYTWREEHIISAAKGLLNEMSDGRIVDQNRLDMLIETGEDKIRVTSISAANIQRNVVTSMSAILLADMHKAHNKTSIDLELLTKLNDNLAALPTASRSDSYRRPLTPAYSLIARQFLEAVDNCDSLTLMNDQAVGLTALIPNELPLKIINHEKSSNNIFTNNHSNEFGKIPTQRMDIGHQAITPGQQIILAANEGVL